MTIDEAIEIKETELEGSVAHSDEELCKAEMLSIEALRAIDSYRKLPFYHSLKLLPGETED